MSIENLDDLVKREPSVITTIKKFVQDANFEEIKALFTDNIPGGEAGQEKDALLCHGKYLGIRYLFKEMKRVAQQKPPTPETKKGSQATDPDLAER